MTYLNQTVAAILIFRAMLVFVGDVALGPPKPQDGILDPKLKDKISLNMRYFWEAVGVVAAVLLLGD